MELRRNNVVRLILDSKESNIIGPSLKKIRLKKKLTQEEVSVKLETQAIYITRSSISKIENQQRIVTDIELLALANVLKVNVHTLLNNEKL